MIKAELISRVAQKLQLPKKEAAVVVNTVFASIADSLSRGEKVELRGFGSFRVKQRPARLGRNPKTGEPVQVPPKKIPYFKPGKNLKVVG